MTFFGRPGSGSVHLEAIRERGVEIDGVEVQEVIPVAVGETGSALAEAELVLFAVKSHDTDATARGIRKHLRPGAPVVSLQNGIENVERLRALGIDALPTVVFVAAAIERPGAVRHRGRGDLVIGDPDAGEGGGDLGDAGDSDLGGGGGAGDAGDPARRARVERVAGWFERAGVPCVVSDDIRREQWIKLALNSMTNGISALTGASYRRLAEFEPTWELALAIGREAIEVAGAEGTVLDLDELVRTAMGVVTGIGEATSSTQQDIAAGRPTEIDSLNGYIARRGAELGIATPSNEAVWALVKLRETTAG